MTHHYKVSGMTCGGCEAKVQDLLLKVPGVKAVHTDLTKGEAAVTMERHIHTPELSAALKDFPKYQLSDIPHGQSGIMDKPAGPVYLEEKRSWLQTYKPILIVFGYILALTLTIESAAGVFLWTRWMNHFMAGFFLTFSFFKLLDLKGFAESYAMYDIVAKRWNGWGYLYAFIELGLGIAFLTGYNPLLTNSLTFAVMTVSVIGVLQSVMNKRKIRCACLGAVFNLPMSTVTILEDLLMIVMSGIMLATMI
jgi:copper chaperone CopZ